MKTYIPTRGALIIVWVNPIGSRRAMTGNPPPILGPNPFLDSDTGPF